MTNMLVRFPFCFPAIIGLLTGLLFPILTVLYLLFEMGAAVSLENIHQLHQNHHDLFIIWTAPFILGFFGSYIGKTNWLLRQKMNTLSNQTVHLNTVLDTAASGIISIDKFGTILSFNHAAEQIFGYANQEILGNNVKLLMPAAVAALHDGYLHQYAQTGETNIIGKRREINCQRKNGDVFPALLQVSPMTINGEQCFTGVVDDISETKILESQLLQAQKLEAIGQLASGVAHEINTPIQYIGDNLAAIKENINEIIDFQKQLYEQAQDDFRPKIDALMAQHDLDYILEDSPKAIEQAIEGVERVSEIVRAMKSFSHIETNQTTQQANLHECLHNALTITRNTYKYIAEIETNFSPEVGYIECFPTELNQVFLNLIVNAAHAIEEKGNGMGLIKISTQALPGMVEILIQDSGVGIAPEIQEKVFNMFFTTKEVGRGTGQGLSLAHNIVVEKHKGHLFFESIPGLGTTFHIQLPTHID